MLFLVRRDLAFVNISEEDVSQQLQALEELKLYTTMNDSGQLYVTTLFDVHRAVHRNIISIIIPTRCTNVPNLFYF